MDYSVWAFLLLAIGILLLIAEVFIPSGGIILVLATVTLLGAIICAWNAWWFSHQAYFWGFISALVLLLPVVAAGALYFWPHTPIGKRAILEAPTPEEVASFVAEEERYARMIGQIGETVTTLNPAGIVRIDSQRVHCQSEGIIIDMGVKVRVISAKANRVIVRRLGLEEQSSLGASAPDAPPPVNQPLDFDIT